jgi:hypothetical protein
MRGRIERRMKKSQSPGRRTRGKTRRQEDKDKGKNEVSSAHWEVRDGR